MPTRLELLQKMVEKGSTDPFVHYGLAMEYRSLGQIEEAGRAFAEMEARFPDYLPQYLMAAQLHEKQGRKDEARRAAEAGLALARRKGDSKTEAEIEGFIGDLL